MNNFATAYGEFSFKPENRSSIVALLMGANLLREHDGELALFTDSEEPHSTDCIDESKFVLAYGYYQGICSTATSIAPLCTSYNFTYFDVELREAGKLTDSGHTIINTPEGLANQVAGATEIEIDAVHMEPEIFEEKHYESHSEIIEVLLQKIAQSL